MIDQKNLIKTKFETKFFRNPCFFEYYRDELLPNLKGRKRIRILSVGCSIGKEAYSIYLINEREGLQAIVEGMDKNQEALEIARTGEFELNPSEWKDEEISLNEFEELVEEHYDSEREIPSKVKINANINFYLFDLFEEKLPREFYDMIVCFNVITDSQGFCYPENKKKMAVDKLYDGLKKGGYLFLDHNRDNSPIWVKREEIGYEITKDSKYFRLIRKQD